MDDVTDVAFRELVAEVGRPDVFFTEFTNCDALFSEGREAHGKRLRYTENQGPIVAQIWGPTPENYYKTAKLLSEMKFDGIDINMGCPQKNITKSGSCSALIQNPSLAQEIIAATKEGAGSLPVSVKTRLGWGTIQTEEWSSFLLQQDIAALTMHGRTVAEMSNVPAHWDEIGKVVQVRNELKKPTLILGNGDVESLEQARRYAQQYDLDGIMIGRGIFRNLWVFNESVDLEQVTVDQRVTTALRHITLWSELWGDTRNFEILKKFLKIYIAGFHGASAARATLMEASSLEELRQLLSEMRKKVVY